MKKNINTIIAELANANAYNLGIFDFNKDEIAGVYHNPLFEGKPYTNEQVIIDNIEEYLCECKTRWYRKHSDSVYDIIKAEVEKAIASNTKRIGDMFEIAEAQNFLIRSTKGKPYVVYAQHMGFKMAD